MWRIANNFIHDTCTGLWLAGVISIYSLAAQVPGMPRAAASALALVEWRLWTMLVIALVGLAVTGGIRLGYWRAQTSPDEVASKRRALIWKHIAFAVVYGGGSIWVFGLLPKGA